ncbi:response regulator [Paenibacillus harenae]|uniref:DNA-binding NarL/FixJ family response regulator n=1 Tax=Paenibacillus harenae TaxID=306543 RepID=A0ABT9TXU8_PAEHA|nr:response regulator transcription factor [Paenibacillus harenae]MDQ0061113.1 DNA-binding NarL/FixJ family response regulator [Paenibacillus harenae]MDQ0111014.1 DNA-binding NarL/FixJ family response regulator [Paenibacillus harenae]
MTDITNAIRVMLVDDHPHGLEGMREIVTSDSAFTVVGEASSGEEALARAAALNPDLVLMDINMPGMGGLEATYRLKQLHPSLKIIMVTVSDDITHLFEAIKRGAQGYLLKNIAPSSWLEYLRAVSVDEAPMSKELAFRLLQEFTQPDKPSPPVAATVLSRKPAAASKPLPDMTTPLTEREKEVLEHVATGASNREIAEALSLSEHTVKNHLKNILQKLHLANRVQLTIYALQQGFVDN